MSDAKSRETEGREWSGETLSQRVLLSTDRGVNGEGRSTGVRLSTCECVFGGKTETGMIKPVYPGHAGVESQLGRTCSDGSQRSLLDNLSDTMTLCWLQRPTYIKAV